MRPIRPFPLLLILPPALCLVSLGCGEVKIEKKEKTAPSEKVALQSPQELHFEDVRQLTQDGVNRRPTFGGDGQRIAWLHRSLDSGDFQVYTMQADGGDARPVPTGSDRCYQPTFSPDGSSILFASAAGDSTPGPGAGAPGAGALPSDDELGLWYFSPALELFRCGLDGSNRVRLTASPGYDAEGSFSWGGAKIVFTSFREGSGDLWLMNADGTAPQRLTSLPGYSGGARISPDGSQVVFHATGGGDGRTVEIYIADLPGGNPRPLTNLRAMSVAPSWHPSQNFIVFSSNASDHDFELYLVRPDGTGLERVTYSPGFDGFADFSRAGDQVVWTSMRGSVEGGRTNIFSAHWVR